MAEDNEGLKEKASEDKPVANLAPIGKSGTLVNNNKVDDEYLAELQNVEGQKLYNKMLRSDSKIRQLYHAVTNPIRSAKWDIEAGSADTSDVELAALIKHIIWKNVPGGWASKLDEILFFPWYGFSALEVIHQNRTDEEFGSYTGLKNLGFRDQTTLTEWEFKDDELVRVRQEQTGDNAVDVWMDVKTLLLFFNERKGNDLGYPFLRMLYGNYKRKLLYKQLQAIGIERSALSVPHLEVPTEVKPSSDEWSLAEDQLRSFTLAETAYFMTPAGYKLTMNATNTFDPGKVQVAIKAENEEIAGSLVGMFLEMGIGGNSGNQAGTETSAKFFRDGLVYIANKICEVINTELIPNLVRLNKGTVKVMPKMVVSGIDETAGESLMRIVTGYAEKGIITADAGLEDHVRKVHNLPKKDEGELADKTKEPGTPGKKPKADDEPEEVELNDKPKFVAYNGSMIFDFAAKENEIQSLMTSSAKKVSEAIKSQIKTSGAKYIKDTMNRYKQLSKDKKQNATATVVLSGKSKLKDALKPILFECSSLAINQARKEVPDKKDVELSSKEKDLERILQVFGETEYKLNDYSKLPAHIQVLVQRQSELISEDSLNEMKKRLDFTFSSIELKSVSEEIIQQNMEEALEDFAEGASVTIKGENVSAIMVNEGRNSFFLDDEVSDSIHSFTFMNRDPKSPICRELAGKTFATNDVESMRYSPPLHHNCKSFLRANLKTSRGVDKLQITTLNPSASAVKTMTL